MCAFACVCVRLRVFVCVLMRVLCVLVLVCVCVLCGGRSVLQALHGCCERAVKGAVIPGCGLEWSHHYHTHVESDQPCLNEWAAMTGLESVRKDGMGQRSVCGPSASPHSPHWPDC